MKLKLNLLTSLLMLAAVGQASAAITQGTAQGGSSLFLSVWDNVRNVSYTRNLGGILNDWLPTGITTSALDGTVSGTPSIGNKTPSTGLNLTFAGDSLFTSTFTGSASTDIAWNIVAFDAIAGTNASGNTTRFVTTGNGTPQTVNGGMGTVVGGGNTYLTALASALASANSAAVTDPSSPAYAGSDAWGDGLNLALNGSSSGTLADQLDFYYIARTTPTGNNNLFATNVQFANNAGVAKWSLAGDGTATFALAGENTPAVPVPAAAWLLASGLVLGLKSARRRKAGNELAAA